MKLLLRFLGFLFAAGTILFVVGVARAARLRRFIVSPAPSLPPGRSRSGGGAVAPAAAVSGSILLLFLFFLASLS